MYAEAFLFGLTIAIAVGPIALLIINASINRGLRAGLSCGAAAASADFSFALLTFTVGSTALILLEAWRAQIAVAAAALLFALGAWLIWQAWRSRQQCCTAAVAAGPGFFATYLLTLANPLTILFFAAWMGTRRAEVTIADSILLALAVFTGSLLVQTLLATGGSVLRPLLARPATLFAANVASGLGIMAFGVYRFAQP